MGVGSALFRGLYCSSMDGGDRLEGFCPAETTGRSKRPILKHNTRRDLGHMAPSRSHVLGGFLLFLLRSVHDLDRRPIDTLHMALQQHEGEPPYSHHVSCRNQHHPASMASAFVQRRDTVENEETVEREGKAILFSDNMSDEDIKNMIFEDMAHLAMHEGGTAWLRLGSILTGNPTNQILVAGFKAIIDQNKIIIRQNELLLRRIIKSKGEYR